MLFLVITVLAIAGFLAISRDKDQDVLKPKVSATIFPLYDLVKEVAGEKIDVELILPPGASPHTFDLKPGDVKKISGSKALFAIGHNLDNWAIKLAGSLGINNISIVDKNINLSKDEEGINPHYFLSIENAIIIVTNIAHTLSSIDQSNSGYYLKNSSEYIRELRDLQEELRGDLRNIQNRKIATFHNAWGYFAKDFGLEVAATFEEFPGKEPTPKYLANFQEEIRKNNIEAIFSEPQFSGSELTPAASDLGVDISILDPLGGIKGRKSYIDLMKFNVNQILNALK